MKLCYMTFKLTKGGFEENKVEAEKLALAIMKRHPDHYVLLAHNSTHFADRNGFKFKSIEFDIAIIYAVDMVIIGKPLDYKESSGSVWEWAIAKTLDKEIVTSDYLLGKVPKPHLWHT